MTVTVTQSDILEWARSYTGASFMACLCDPPYELAFMNRSWDSTGIAFQPDTWAALAQHLYPGAFVFAFSGTRGYHRMACAMEDAGLIIHPAICWCFASGFPKATRIDTAIDKAAGAARDVVGFNGKKRGENRVYSQYNDDDRGDPITAPATPLAQAWAGHRYGLQALKPSFEFIAVAQVPYRGRPLDCITATGAGALNIDQARVATDDDLSGGTYGGIFGNGKKAIGSGDKGRWPSNLLLSHDPACAPDACIASCPARVLGEQSGESVSSASQRGKVEIFDETYKGKGWIGESTLRGHDDSGTAARFYYNADWMLDRLESTAPFYYQAKAHTGERECGLDSSGDTRANIHPTVKPLSLTKYLASLLLPPDMYAPRRLLTPFCGVASEMIGALLAGWEEILGIEREAEYVSIGRERLDWWHAAMQQTGLADPETIRTRVGTLDKVALTAQGRLPLQDAVD